jgi:hypothetical protein
MAIITHNCHPLVLLLMLPLASSSTIRIACTVQTTSLPRTSYRMPIITGMALESMTADGDVQYTNATGALSSLWTQGGQFLVLFGDFFGPSIPNLVTRMQGGGTARGLGLLNDHAVVVSTQCSVTVEHVQLRCLTPQGVGEEYAWQVRQQCGGH